MTTPKSVSVMELCSQQYPLNPEKAARNYEVHGYTVIAKTEAGERVIGVRHMGNGNVRAVLESGEKRTLRGYVPIKLEFDYTPVAVHKAARPILAKYQTVIPLSGGGVRLKGLTSPNPNEWTPETKAQVEKYLSKELTGQVRISDRTILWNGKQVGHIGALYGEIVAKINNALMGSAEEKDYVLPPERTGNLAEDDTTIYAARRPRMKKGDDRALAVITSIDKRGRWARYVTDRTENGFGEPRIELRFPNDFGASVIYTRGGLEIAAIDFGQDHENGQNGVLVPIEVDGQDVESIDASELDGILETIQGWKRDNIIEGNGTIKVRRPRMKKEAQAQGEWKWWTTKDGTVYERIYTDKAGTRFIANITEKPDGTYDATLDADKIAYQKSERGLKDGKTARKWIEDQLARMAKRLGKRFGSIHGDTDQKNYSYLGEPMVLRQGTNIAHLAIPVEFVDANGKRQKRTVDYELTFEWEGDHVVDVERPDNRKIAQALNAKQVTLVDFPTAMQVELALQGNTVEDEDESFARAAKPAVRKRAPRLFILSKAEEKSGAMVALMLKPKTGQKLLDALPDGAQEYAEPVDDLHITLVYLGESKGIEDKKGEIEAAIAQVAKSYAPVRGEVSGYGVFNGEQKVIYASYDSPDLSRLRQALWEALSAPALGLSIPEDHGFTPHITLAYVPSDDVELSMPTTPASFDALTLAWEKDHQEFPLELATKRLMHKAYNAYDDKMKPALKALIDAENKFGRGSNEYSKARFDYLDALDSYMAHISDSDLWGHVAEYSTRVDETNNLSLPWDAIIEVDDPSHLTETEKYDLRNAYSRIKSEETE